LHPPDFPPLDFAPPDFSEEGFDSVEDLDSADFDSDFAEPLSDFSPLDFAEAPSDAFVSASAAFL
jgi:hypothetical protein